MKRTSAALSQIFVERDLYETRSRRNDLASDQTERSKMIRFDYLNLSKFYGQLYVDEWGPPPRLDESNIPDFNIKVSDNGFRVTIPAGQACYSIRNFITTPEMEELVDTKPNVVELYEHSAAAMAIKLSTNIRFVTRYNTTKELNLLHLNALGLQYVARVLDIATLGFMKDAYHFKYYGSLSYQFYLMTGHIRQDLAPKMDNPQDWRFRIINIFKSCYITQALVAVKDDNNEIFCHPAMSMLYGWMCNVAADMGLDGLYIPSQASSVFGQVHSRIITWSRPAPMLELKDVADDDLCTAKLYPKHKAAVAVNCIYSKPIRIGNIFVPNVRAFDQLLMGHYLGLAWARTGLPRKTQECARIAVLNVHYFEGDLRRNYRDPLVLDPLAELLKLLKGCDIIALNEVKYRSLPELEQTFKNEGYSLITSMDMPKDEKEENGPNANKFVNCICVRDDACTYENVVRLKLDGRYDRTAVHADITYNKMKLLRVLCAQLDNIGDRLPDKIQKIHETSANTILTAQPDIILGDLNESINGTACRMFTDMKYLDATVNTGTLIYNPMSHRDYIFAKELLVITSGIIHTTFSDHSGAYCDVYQDPTMKGIPKQDPLTDLIQYSLKL